MNTNSGSAQPSYNPTPTSNVLNSVQSGVQKTDTMIKNINSIKNGLKGLGF